MNRFASALVGFALALAVLFCPSSGGGVAHAHEVYGVIVRDGNQLVLSNFMGFTDFGSLSAQAGLTNPTYHVSWYDQDQLELDLVGVTGHQLVVTVADTTILKAEVFPNPFDVRFTGRAPGHTTVRLGFVYFSTPEFTSVPLDVEVLATAAVGPLPATTSVRLSAITNPARRLAHVAYATTASGLHRFDVLDVQGRVRQKVEVEVASPGSHALDLDVSALDPGLYFLRLAGAGTMTATRFAVAR